MISVSQGLAEGGTRTVVGFDELFRLGPIEAPKLARPPAFDPTSEQRIVSYYEDDMDRYQQQVKWRVLQRTLLFGVGGILVAALVYFMSR